MADLNIHFTLMLKMLSVFQKLHSLCPQNKLCEHDKKLFLLLITTTTQTRKTLFLYPFGTTIPYIMQSKSVHKTDNAIYI